MIDSIITTDETFASYHTTDTKKSKQWIHLSQPGPLKKWVNVSWTKEVAIGFFDLERLIYTHIYPRGASINATDIVKALGKFSEYFKQA